MNGKHLFLTSAGLTDKMKEKFFDIIGKCPKDVKVLYIPTAGIETDGARESLAICFHELFLMGIQYENILVYNLELILFSRSKYCFYHFFWARCDKGIYYLFISKKLPYNCEAGNYCYLD